MRRVLALSVSLACCSGAPRGPYFGDERFLVVGTNPKREADALVTQMRAHGYEKRLRLDGRDFTAVDFVDAEGNAGPLRVITAHGIVLALDSGPRGLLNQARIEYRLLLPPLPRTHDVDSDGLEEIFVEESDLAVDAACVRVQRVMQDGRLREVHGIDPLGRAECERGSAPDGGTPPADGGVPSNAVR